MSSLINYRGRFKRETYVRSDPLLNEQLPTPIRDVVTCSSNVNQLVLKPERPRIDSCNTSDVTYTSSDEVDSDGVNIHIERMNAVRDVNENRGPKYKKLLQNLRRFPRGENRDSALGAHCRALESPQDNVPFPVDKFQDARCDFWTLSRDRNKLHLRLKAYDPSSEDISSSANDSDSECPPSRKYHVAHIPLRHRLYQESNVHARSTGWSRISNDRHLRTRSLLRKKHSLRIASSDGKIWEHRTMIDDNDFSDFSELEDFEFSDSESDSGEGSCIHDERSSIRHRNFSKLPDSRGNGNSLSCTVLDRSFYVPSNAERGKSHAVQMRMQSLLVGVVARWRHHERSLKCAEAVKHLKLSQLLCESRMKRALQRLNEKISREKASISISQRVALNFIEMLDEVRHEEKCSSKTSSESRSAVTGIHIPLDILESDQMVVSLLASRDDFENCILASDENGVFVCGRCNDSIFQLKDRIVQVSDNLLTGSISCAEVRARVMLALQYESHVGYLCIRVLRSFDLMSHIVAS